METCRTTDGCDVLVVEDEMRVRDMLARALKEMGFRSNLAPTAEAAAKILAERTFDIVILDLNLPGMDGMEFLRLIRQRRHDVEVIILTGFGDLEAAKSAIHLDVVDFLTKPYTLGTLESALDRARKRIKARIIQAAPGADLFADEAEAEDDAAPAVFEAEPATGEALDDVECRQILRLLDKHAGNRALTAAELGISQRKLYYRLGEYKRKGLME